METKIRRPIPLGKHVRVEQRIVHGAGEYTTTVEGEVISHDVEPTGAWYAHGKNGRLWLARLRIKKPDGEISALNLDSNSRITILTPGP